MSLISIVCFGALALLISISLWRGSDILSPGKAFLIVWTLSIGLVELKLSYFQFQWPLYSWLVLLIGLLAFMIGTAISCSLYLDQKIFPVKRMRGYFSNLDYDERKFFRSILVLALAYFTCFILEAKIRGNLPILSRRPDVARMAFGVFGLHLLVNAMPALLLLITQYLFVIKKKRAKKIFLCLLFMMVFVSFVSLLDRFDFMIWAITAVAFLYYTDRRFSFKKVLLATLPFAAILFAIVSVREAAYARNYLYLVSRMKFPAKYGWFTGPYMYISMNLENFSRGVLLLTRHTYGYFTGDFILALTGLKHWIGTYSAIDPTPFFIGGYNTYSFLWDYYYDFGVLGVGILPLLLGITIGLIYYSLRTRPTISKAMLYSLMVYVIALTFFANVLTMLKFVTNVAILMLAERSIVTRRGRSASSKLTPNY